MRRALIILPTVLLLTVAGVQMVLARTALLSPWKGGGFGMFAAVDGLPFRWLRIYVTAQERSEELAVPMSLQDQAHRVATWPREPSLRAFALSVVDRERRLNRPVDTVRVEVWRADISTTLDFSETLIAHTTVHANGLASTAGR